ncbi:uncharacterized protein LOC143901065 [Temnothorax americanus]|uniref:uncharacterized protein LOC143901065 n=1 Tax=Temnothorax americanus TaxID=1964332 RepID=UPI0040690771
MTGCSADYCTNSSSKGFQMCRFPRVEKRRKVWIVNVNRADWVPGVSSTLCLIHFSDEMWRETRGGKRRLKSTAVPTIFGDRLIQTSVQEEDEPKNIPENEHENFNNTSQEAQERPINNGDVHNNSEEIQETEGSIEELKEKTPFEETLEQRFNRLQKLYDKSEKSRIALKKSLIAANKRNKKLQQEMQSSAANIHLVLKKKFKI